MGVTSEEHLSPELVLVDETSTPAARAALPDPVDTLERILTECATSAREVSAARERIIELSDVEPPQLRRSYRVPKLAGALATWSVAALLLVETRLVA